MHSELFTIVQLRVRGLVEGKDVLVEASVHLVAAKGQLCSSPSSSTKHSPRDLIVSNVFCLSSLRALMTGQGRTWQKVEIKSKE